MNDKGNAYAEAITKEVESWPGVTVEFSEGSKHPKAKFTYNGDSLFRPFSGTHGFAFAQMLGDMRRVMRQLGAERSKPDPKPEEDDATYRKPPPKPVPRVQAGEPVERKDGIGGQLLDLGLAPDAPAASVPTKIAARAAVREPEPEPEPLGPGEHDIDAERYHSDPCPEPSLSASIAKLAIEKSLYHARHQHPRLNPEHEQTDKLIYRFGRAFHTMLFGHGAAVEVFDYRDWKKDIAKADKADSLARGCTPLLPDQFRKIEEMVRAAKRQISRREDLAYAMAGGRPERVFIWVEDTPSGPVYCRMMADWTPHTARYGVDWKTTGAGAGPDAWGQRTMWDSGCDIQDAFYRRGWRKTIGLDVEALIFAVVETDEPHAMMHHRIMPATQAGADMEVQWAIRAWGACLKSGRWPGYPLDMAWQEKPGWRADRQQGRWDSGQRDLEILDTQLAALTQIADSSPRRGDVEMTDDNPFGLPAIETGGSDGI